MSRSFGNDQLNFDTLRASLGEDGRDFSLHAFSELDSTNSEAKRLAVAGAHTPALIVAERQTAGRGRMGRSFYSPANTGVYFSILFDAKTAMEEALSVTSAVAVAVMRAIRRLCDKQTAIKWVNDLYLEGKKVCGILTEAISGLGEPSKIVVGIGINLRTNEFPSELQSKAGSLGDGQLSRAELIAGVVHELLPYLRDPTDDSWLDDYRTHSCVIGRTVTWTKGDKHCSGVAVGIDGRGALEIRLPDGSSDFLRTGEISVFAEEWK
ncbi:MAG: biotin--[Clostridia bacterium]|nr:biotin--[acetyl-CoA-carboxylase] ligase [Clostridia bacterium]